MADFISIEIDKKSMVQIQKGLEKLFPKDRATNNALKRALRKAALPLKRKVKSLIKSKAFDTGRLYKSIRIFDSKRNTRAGRPSVFVGPLVKVPKKITKNKEMTMEERRQASEQWKKEASGYYFYILEYGFNPRGSNTKVLGLGLLPDAVTAAGPETAKNVEVEIIKMLNNKAQKVLGTKVVNA
jgi:hypothetical protein